MRIKLVKWYTLDVTLTFDYSAERLRYISFFFSNWANWRGDEGCTITTPFETKYHTVQMLEPPPPLET